MELTDQQKAAVTAWAKEGCDLSTIQKKLAEDFGISATYMDVRFLIIDLGIEIKDKETSTGLRDLSEAPDQGSGLGADVSSAQAAGATHGVSVEIDRITKPGAMVSGTVTFSDGISASWALDQLGRLVLDAGTPDYKPTQEDLQEFQLALKQELQNRGF